MKNLLTAIVLFCMVVSCDYQNENVEPEVELVTQELVDNLLQSKVVVDYYATDLYVKSKIELAYQQLTEEEADQLKLEIMTLVGMGEAGFEEIDRLIGFEENTFFSLIDSHSENARLILEEFPVLADLSTEDFVLVEDQLMENELFTTKMHMSFNEKLSVSNGRTGECIAALFGCSISILHIRVLENIGCQAAFPGVYIPGVSLVNACTAAIIAAGITDVFDCGITASQCFRNGDADDDNGGDPIDFP
ncbi:MAG: hypothetical protein AAFQ94_27015 [Bacteroidota bacterium]